MNYYSFTVSKNPEVSNLSFDVVPVLCTLNRLVLFLEAISKMNYRRPFDASPKGGLAQGEQMPVHPE